MINRLLKIAISLLYFASTRIISFFKYIIKKEKKKIIVVLMYHSVEKEKIQKFEKQMDEVLKYTNPVPVTNIDQKDCGKLNIAVTFDDGYQSIFKYALPALIARNIPATIFIPSGYIGMRLC